jgi:hypothetical protein
MVTADAEAMKKALISDAASPQLWDHHDRDHFEEDKKSSAAL